MTISTSIGIVLTAAMWTGQTAKAPTAMPLDAAPPATQHAPAMRVLIPLRSQSDEPPVSESALAEEATAKIKNAIAAGGEPDAPARAIAAARFVLSQACEPALSRLAHCMATDEDRRRLAAHAGAVEELLAALGSAGDEYADSRRETFDGKTVIDVAQSPRFLRTLANMYAALAGSVDPERSPVAAADAAPLLDACRDMAPFVDDPQLEISNLARMLQAMAYRRAGRPDRTIEVLGPSGTHMAMLPYEVFARIEYCRALGDQGNVVPAIAIATRLEAGTAAQVPFEFRDATTHALRLLRIKLYEDWERQISRGEEANSIESQHRITTIAGQITTIRKSLPESGEIRLYRLGRVLPPIDGENAD